MKKLLSLLLAAMMLLSFAAVASADTGTIPLYADELNLPAIKSIPTIYTEHKEDAYGRGTTTLWSSMVLDSATVMVYDSSVHYNVPVALDLVDGTSATYSTTGLKRQVGITYSGGYAYTIPKIYEDMGYVSVGEYSSEDEMYGALIDEYVKKGWKDNEIHIDAQYEEVSDVLNFYVNVEGKKQYVGYYDVKDLSSDEKKQTAENVIRYLVETEGYNEKALSFKEESKSRATGEYHVYIQSGKQNVYRNWNGGDDAYYLTVGNQTSLHGRSGKVYQVSVAVDEDLFNTDMGFVNGTVTYKKNGNNGAWYPAKVTMNYDDTSAVRSLSADYLPTYNLGLQGYTVTISANGTTYVLNYNAWGGFESADAYNGSGTYHSTGARAFDWANKSNWKYVRNFSLLSLSKLKSLFTRLY